jgi:hypothetical protein
MYPHLLCRIHIAGLCGGAPARTKLRHAPHDRRPRSVYSQRRRLQKSPTRSWGEHVGVHRSMLRGPVVRLHFLERPTVHKPAVLLSQERTPTALTKHLRPGSSNGVQVWVHPTTNTRASTASEAKRVRDDDSSVRGSPARPLWDGRPALWHRQPRDSCSLPQLGPGVCPRVPQRRAVDKAGEPHVCRVV